MEKKFDVMGFAHDFRSGMKDKDLLEKHHIDPKRMIDIVRKLINRGILTKEDYFARSRKIEEREVQEEKQFLKSLYHCPVCGHMHPAPFTRCPACGADTTAEEQRPAPQPPPRPAPRPAQQQPQRPAAPPRPDPRQGARPAGTRPQQQAPPPGRPDQRPPAQAKQPAQPQKRQQPHPAAPGPAKQPEQPPQPQKPPRPQSPPPSQKAPTPKTEARAPEQAPRPAQPAEHKPAPKPKPAPPKPAPAPPPPPPPAEEEEVKPEISEALQKVVGVELENISVYPGAVEGGSLGEYHITDIIASHARATVFKAEESDGNGPDLAIKMFNPDIAEDADITKLIDKIAEFQSNMQDPNIVRLLATAELEDAKVLVYEYLPWNLDTLFKDYPDGLPYEMIEDYMRQVCNGVGYAHTHRGKDDVVRRLPHLNLKITKLLLDEEKKVIKIDDFGVGKALQEIRGHKKNLYDEPGADLGSTPPEAFVLRSKSVKPLSADIYSLGVTFYRLTTGKYPFEGKDMEEYKFAHLKKFPIPPKVHRYDCPEWLDAMILKCLEKDPDHRWRSATEMEMAVGKSSGKE